MESKTYIEWLNKQKDRKDSLGDLVRKFLTDKNIKSWYGFRDHLERLGAIEDEIKICEKSWVEYTSYLHDTYYSKITIGDKMTLEKQEIRILQPKISDEKTDSFFYSNSIAHAIRSDGTAILLIANGDIRIEIDGEDYDNKTKEKAIDKYDLTDKKLADLEKEGILTWGNNNWFEILWTRDGMESWESVNNTVKYDYDTAIQIFKDCYNRKDLNKHD